MTSFDLRQLHNTSQVLLRNESALAAERVLVAGMPDDRFALELHNSGLVGSIQLFTTDFHVYQHLRNDWQKLGCKEQALQFGSCYQAEQAHDLLILFARKSREETAMLLDMLLPALTPGARILLVGENQAGIKSQGRLLEQAGSWAKLDSARHCVLFEALLENEVQPFSFDRWIKTFDLSVAGQDLKVCTLPGVFSHGRLDEGTELLLEQLQKERLRGKILDFGCGAGVIGAWAALAGSDTVQLYMLDNSALALEATRRTLAANNLSAAQFIGSNGFSEVEGRYRFILSNPPFHTGVKTNYDITETMLQQVPRYLVSGGRLCIVANSFLKYPQFIEQGLGRCETPVKNRRFAIYTGQRK